MTPGSRKPETPIEVSAHDTSQLEIKVVHRVPEGIPVGSEITYKQDIYLFMPKSLGLRSDVYSKDHFYRSLTNYIRVKTPRVLGDEELQTCRLDRILPKLHAAAVACQRPVSVSGSVNEVRLFGAYVSDQLKLLSKADDPAVIHIILEDIADLMVAFRGVMDTMVPLFDEGRWTHVREAFRYIDEFLSNRYEEVVVQFQKQGLPLAKTMEPEFRRRADKGYLQVLAGDNGTAAAEAERERYVFRMGRFKKYISELLYLEVKRQRHDRIFTNLAAAFGAAAAALVNSLADPNQRTSISGRFVDSMRDSLFIMVGIVALVYVFKDRLKDYLRESLLVWLKPWLPDYSFKIRSKKGAVIARCREEVRFVHSKQVNAEIRRLRAEGVETIVHSDSFEDVCHYSRGLKIDRKELELLFRNTNSLKDILRFDFNPFLTKLSNAKRKDDFMGKDGGVYEVELPKVYHVNVVIRHQVRTKENGILSCHYARARVVLDKDGIKRIEPVETPAQPVQQSESQDRLAA